MHLKRFSAIVCAFCSRNFEQQTTSAQLFSQSITAVGVCGASEEGRWGFRGTKCIKRVKIQKVFK